MSIPEKLSDAISRWIDIFMFKSIQELLKFLKDNNLSMAHYMIFMYIYKLGPCGVTDIASLLNVSKPSASQMVDRLVKQGLLTRSENLTDRRIINVILTPAGEEITRKCITARSQWLESLPPLTRETQESISNGLEELTVATIKITEGHHENRR